MLFVSLDLSNCKTKSNTLALRGEIDSRIDNVAMLTNDRTIRGVIMSQDK